MIILSMLLVLLQDAVTSGADANDSYDVYTNEWSVHIPGGVEHAKVVASDTGCRYVGEIIEGEDYYLFSCHKVSRRDTESHDEIHQTFDGHHHVTADTAQQQKVLNRTKRAPLSVPSVDKMYWNDPEWSNTWYLNRGDKLDMNVQEAWALGVTGKGVVVSILDDGIEKDHPDLVENYDQDASYDMNDNNPDPSPRYDPTNINRHGTRCAGEVAACANNSVCSVGIAYESKVGGVRMLDGDVTDAVEARSLSLNIQHIDIYSASWGPDDDGRTVDGPGNLARKAFVKGVDKGRGGKGSIFVWASGNGGKAEDNCNCDGYTNSIWTLSVASASENGQIPWYSEACSSTLATTYSSGSKEKMNGVGRSYSHNFGYGLMDAAGMVRMAQKWRSVGDQIVSVVEARNLPLSIPAGGNKKPEIKVSGDQVKYLEHVQAHITIDTARRGNLRIYLTSPKGTKSQLLTSRSRDTSSHGFQDWPFLTVFSWGEDPAGTWVLEVENTGGSEATLRKWSLKFHGTVEDPDNAGSGSYSSGGRMERVDTDEEISVSRCQEGYYEVGEACKVVPPPAWAYLYE